MKKIASLLLALVLACSLTVPICAEAFNLDTADDLTGTILLLHTNDVHGGIAGYAQAVAVKKTCEKAGAYVLLLDAGDYIQGDPSVSLSQGETAIELMNLAGYDAAALGNHEFDYGYENLTRLARKAKFPILSANTLYQGAVAFGSNKIFTAPDGTKLGVFGLTTPESGTKAHPGKIKGVTFPGGEEMYRIAQKQVDALRSAGCDYIVCLGHLGIDEESVGNRSIDLLNAVNGIDIFLDGHSHSTQADIRAAVGSRVNGTLLTSTGTKLANLGCVAISPEGDITATELAVSTLTTAPDTVTASRIAAIQTQIDEDYGAVFAKSVCDLNGAKAPNGNRDSETNLGDLIADALVWGAAQNGEAVDAAIVNGGGIRAAISAGSITKKDINTVLPFGNTLNLVKITGQELLEALEASTYCTPEAVGGFPQTSGMEWTLDTTADYVPGALYPGSTYYAPESINRVTIQTVGGSAFDETAVYSVATNDFMASGGDTYYAFSAASASYDIGVPLDEVLMEYITTELGGVVDETYAQSQNRLTVVTETAVSGGIAPMPTVQVELYTVVSGDCLWDLANRFYGSGAQYGVIAAANRLTAPYLLHIGQTLEIPVR